MWSAWLTLAVKWFSNQTDDREVVVLAPVLAARCHLTTMGKFFMH